MQLDLTDEETGALLNLLTGTIEGDQYPMSPRINRLNRHPTRRSHWDALVVIPLN
jgi:hypothetical protein